MYCILISGFCNSQKSVVYCIFIRPENVKYATVSLGIFVGLHERVQLTAKATTTLVAFQQQS